jgi:hypothetical protein
MALPGQTEALGEKPQHTKIRVPTSQKTQSDPVTKTNRLMLFREIIALIMNKMEHTHRMWAKCRVSRLKPTNSRQQSPS